LQKQLVIAAYVWATGFHNFEPDPRIYK